MESALATELPHTPPTVATRFAPSPRDGGADLIDAVAAASAAPSITGRISDFIELAKPRMNFLVLVTTAVGYFMAAHGWDDWSRLLHTLIGTALTAGGASVLNQYAERGFDLQMRRTRNRPLPANRVSPTEALAWAVALAGTGLIELLLFVNPLTALLGALTLLSYVFIYTPMKRWTSLCTIVGAVPGAIPIIMGWSAARGELSIEAWAMFSILFMWQMPHFLAIAILYRDDYAAGGFKMLPVVDPHLNATGRQIILYGLVLIPISLLPTFFQIAGIVYFVAALVLGLVFVSFGIICAVTKSRVAARQLFLVSIAYLPLLMAAMMLNKQ